MRSERKKIAQLVYSIRPDLERKSVVTELLKLLDIQTSPTKLTGIVFAAQRLLHVSSNWDTPNQLSRETLLAIRDCCQVIIQNEILLKQEIGEHVTSTIRQSKTKHPLYQIFNVGCRPDPETENAYQKLIVHVVNSYHGRKYTLGQSPITLYLGCEALRALTDEYEKENALRYLDPKAQSVHEISSSLKNIAKSGEVHSESTVNHLNTLATYISRRNPSKDILDRKSVVPLRSRGPERGYTLAISRAKNPTAIPTEPDTWIPYQAEIFDIDWNEDSESPEENDEGPYKSLLIESGIGGSRTKAKALALIIARSMGQNTQLTKYKWNHLWNREILCLLNSIGAQNNPELMLVIILMNLRGLNLQTIRRIVLVVDPKKLPINQIAIHMDSELVFFPILRPDRKRDPSQLDTHFQGELPDIFWKLLPKINFTKSPSPFSRHEKTYAEKIRKFLAELNKSQNMRLTMEKIRTQVVTSGRTLGIDDTILSQIITEPISCSRSQMCYTRHSSETINQSYRNILRHFLNGYPTDHPQLTIKKSSPMLIKSNCVGDEKAICIKKVTELRQHLVNKYKRIKSTRLSEIKLAYLHNAYVTYCLVMLGFLTGYRGNNNPIQNIECLDKQLGLLLLQDKNVAGEYRTRTVYAPESLICQFEEYRAFQISTLQKIALFDPETLEAFRLNIHPKLLNPATIGTGDTDQHTASPVTENCFPFFFFIDPNTLKFQEIRMRQWEMNVQFHGFVKDSGRHFLRTELVMRGCPLDIINAHIGHWHRGAEAYGKASCLSPIQVRDQIKPYIHDIINETGFAVLKP